jgi:hypothetical protein
MLSSENIGSASNSIEKDPQDLIIGRGFGLIECQLQAQAESSAL